MPNLAHNWLVPDIGDLRRHWGEQRMRLANSRVLSTVTEILARIDDERWVRPESVYRIRPVEAGGPGWLELGGRTRLRSPLAAHRMRRATRLAVGICTLGAGLDERVRETFAAGEALRAVLLDEIGSLMIYRLADRLERLIRSEARRLGLEASGVLCPGDPGFDLHEQRLLLDLAGGSSVGVSVTPGGMLTPQKSLTLVMGLGTRMPAWSHADNCARCRARNSCPHRRPSPGCMIA